MQRSVVSAAAGSTLGSHRFEAATVLRTALQKNPQSVIVLNNLAQTLSDLGRHAEALALLDRADRAQSPFASEVRATRQRVESRMKR